LTKFGNLKDAEEVEELHKVLKPYLVKQSNCEDDITHASMPCTVVYELTNVHTCLCAAP
jgi:hypothetical protein